MRASGSDCVGAGGSQEGSFHDLASLCECVKASCMLPGVAGTEPPWLRGRCVRGKGGIASREAPRGESGCRVATVGGWGC